MPTSLLSTDTMFPNFEGNETTEEKVNQIQNYLYMLVEQLRYSMANVGKENFNETEFDSIVNLITEPVYIQLSDSEKKTNSYIQATAETLTARIEGVNTNLGETNQTVATLQASVNGFNTTVQEISGKYTRIEQTVSSIKLSATEDANGNTSSITLSGTGIKTTSANIKFKGEVTFEALQGATDSVRNDTAAMYNSFVNGLQTPGTTIIDGGNIVTGTIKGVTYYSEGGSTDGSFVVTANNYSRIIGGITYTQEIDYATDPSGVFADKMWLYTEAKNGKYPSIKLDSVGRISIEARNLKNVADGGGIYIYGGGYITIECPYKISVRQGRTYWDFEDGILKKNGTQVL